MISSINSVAQIVMNNPLKTSVLILSALVVYYMISNNMAKDRARQAEQKAAVSEKINEIRVEKDEEIKKIEIRQKEEAKNEEDLIRNRMYFDAH